MRTARANGVSVESRAIREMLREAPPIIVAGMLSYSSTGAEKIAAEYGAPGSATPAWTGSPAARRDSPTEELDIPVHVRALVGVVIQHGVI